LRVATVAGLFALLSATSSSTAGPNGFVLEPSSVPAQEILPGGPPRDGIPALLAPNVVAAPQADWGPDQPVIGVSVNGEARAYPIALLVWHELVNDTLGGSAILVSYCPLCGTAMVFDRELGERPSTFGVSGLLYRSDLLLYDRETESLWSQILGAAVTGPLVGTRLELVRAEQTRWGDWRERHPSTTVLSRETGHRRDYDRSPYGDYATSSELYFRASFDPRYHPKTPTLGMRTRSGAARAYPASELARVGGAVDESFEGMSVSVRYDPKEQVFHFRAPPEIEVIEGFWFAWSAFHPETTVFVAPLPAQAGSAGGFPDRGGSSP
jgi:hypothetical protein